MVDDNAAMMERLGRTEAVIELSAPLSQLPAAIAAFPVELREGGTELVYRGGDGTGKGRQEIADLTKALTRADIDYRGIDIHDSSLEDIFVDLLSQREAAQ
jgi:ABC-2 type transport system ATP-binding protein